MTFLPGEIPPRLNTSLFGSTDARTRALVVFNDTEATVIARVRFAARFPVRADAYPQPVIVRNERGAVLPSRFSRSLIGPDPTLPPGRVWWDTELEFIVDFVPARGWRTFSATFGHSADSRTEDICFWEHDAPPFRALLVLETDCHQGDLPLTFPENDALATI